MSTTTTQLVHAQPVSSSGAASTSFSSPGRRLGSEEESPVVATAWLVPEQEQKKPGAFFSAQPLQNKMPEPIAGSATITTTTHHVSAPQMQSTAAGYEELKRMGEDRKRRTIFVALVGGGIGYYFFGPLGAVLIAVGGALVTHTRLLRKEELFKQRVESGQFTTASIATQRGRSRRTRHLNQ